MAAWMRFWASLWMGSSLISARIGSSFRKGPLLRLVLLVVGAFFAKGLPRTTEIAGTLAVLWIVTALMLGLREPMPGATVATDEQPETRTGEPEKELDQEAVAALLRGLLQEKGGVHLKALAKVLPGGPWPTREVRALLGRVGIRVRAGVRVPGEGGREGVHRDDIPAPTPPASEATPVGVVTAGQSNNNNASNTPEEGMTITRDPVRRNRWMVIRDR